jgi:hypothetical protein
MATGRIPQKRVLGDANATAQRSLTNTKIMQNQNKLDNMQQQLFDMIYPIGIIITTIPEVTLDPQYWKRLGDPVEGFALVSTGADSKTVGTTSGVNKTVNLNYVGGDYYALTWDKGYKVNWEKGGTGSSGDGYQPYMPTSSKPSMTNLKEMVKNNFSSDVHSDNNLAAGYYVNFWQRI